MRFSIIGLLYLALCGCISMNPGLGGGPPCAMTSDGDLLLRGSTTEPMLACVRALKTAPVKRVVLDSNGGPVAVAVQIGEILADYHAEMVIRGQCNSSCANYFLPVARKITVEAGSLVLLHGSLDDNTLAQTAGDPAKTRQQYDAQMAYVERHHIHRGWLMMRSAEDFAARRPSQYVSGQIGQPFLAGASSIKAMLVEEVFMRSCLPDVEITPFKDTMAQRVYVDESAARALARQGVFPSGSIACVDTAR